MKAPLTIGAYEARSVLASAQRSVNLYMEPNPKDSPFPFMLYPMPGISTVAVAEPSTVGGWRGLYWATNDKLYGVCGDTLYAISEGMNLTALGQMISYQGIVHMVDNGTTLIAVDGTTNGYQVNLEDDSFSLINQGSFYGGDYIDMVDGYFVLNRPGTNQWYISLNNQASFDATDFASKNGFPDRVVGVGVARRYLYLFGQMTTEVWFNAGNTAFPFERLPGVFMQYGCMNANTIAQMDGDFCWLAQSEQGNRIVCRAQQFQATKISTFAMDSEIAGYETVDDAFGYTFQVLGHTFYVLSFPSAQKTWCYDLATQQWCEWLSINNDGEFLRHRSNCYALAYGRRLVGDFENGNLYEVDPNVYLDNGQPIPRVRGFYHGVDDESSRLSYREFIADMEVGNGAGNVEVPMYLRWSDTRGKSWGNAIETSLGLEGEYIKSLQFQRLGMARDRVFEIWWSAPVRTALSGAWVQVTKHNE